MTTPRYIQRGEVYSWRGVRCEVTRVARDRSWADIRCTSGYSTWTKRQKIPASGLPAEWVLVQPAVT